MDRPLDFAVFAAVLSVTTLLKLSLNVASTRAMLLDGHTGTGAAGKVIESFGHFLIGGNFAVGLVVFAVLVVTNFIVVARAPSASPKAACFHPRCHAKQADGHRRRLERRTDQ